jgi:hypothetical protein
MSINWKAFGEKLALGVAGGIEKRIEKGEKELEKEELKAERNIPTFKKRMQQKELLESYARTLEKMGASIPQIMFFLRLGPSGFQKQYQEIVDKAKAYKDASGEELSKEAVSDMMQMPQEFPEAVKDMTIDSFLDRAYRLSSENDEFEKPETEEILKGNLFKGMLGIGVKDRVKKKLETEKFLGDLTIAEINRVAGQKDFIDPVSGFETMPVIDPTAGPAIIDYPTRIRILDSYKTKKEKVIADPTAEVASYFRENELPSDKLLNVTTAIKKQSPSMLKTKEERDIYDKALQKLEYDAFMDAAGGRVNKETVKFFDNNIQALYEAMNPTSDTKTQVDMGGTQQADFASKEEFKKAKDERRIIADREYTYIEGGEIKSKSFTQSELDIHYGKADAPSANVASSQAKGILSQAEFDALPDDVGDPPGTALTPSGAVRDQRNEWFARYGDTHKTNGKKKTYMQYKSTVDPASSPNPYVQGDQYMTGG